MLLVAVAMACCRSPIVWIELVTLTVDWCPVKSVIVNAPTGMAVLPGPYVESDVAALSYCKPSEPELTELCAALAAIPN